MKRRGSARTWKDWVRDILDHWLPATVESDGAIDMLRPGWVRVAFAGRTMDVRESRITVAAEELRDRAVDDLGESATAALPPAEVLRHRGPFYSHIGRALRHALAELRHGLVGSPDATLTTTCEDFHGLGPAEVIGNLGSTLSRDAKRQRDEARASKDTLSACAAEVGHVLTPEVRKEVGKSLHQRKAALHKARVAEEERKQFLAAVAAVDGLLQEPHWTRDDLQKFECRLRPQVQRSQRQKGSRMDKKVRVLDLARRRPDMPLRELADRAGLHVNTLSKPEWRDRIETARAIGRRDGGAAAGSGRPRATGRRRAKPPHDANDDA